MLKHPKFVSRFGRARGIQRTAVSLLAVGGFIGAASLASVAVSSASGAAAAQPAAAGAPCTFTLGSQSSSGTTAAPAILTGVGNGNTVSVSCTGLISADQLRHLRGQPTGGGDRTLQPQRAGQRGGHRLGT